ncbi:MAG: hypothetical protein NZM42_05070 [Gemmatales bacterium]|nr:hypothetical protein [Gemmatales bacterium]
MAVRRPQHLLHPVGSLHRQPPQVVGSVAKHPQHLPGPRLPSHDITGAGRHRHEQPARSAQWETKLRTAPMGGSLHCGLRI